VFTCEGDFFAVGSVGNMVHITSNTYEPYAGDWNAIKLTGIEHGTLSGAVISFGGNGVALKNARSVLIDHCLFQDCKFSALSLHQVQSGEISHNLFQRNDTGVFCQASTDVAIADNIYIGNTQGIESELSAARIDNNYFHSSRMAVHVQFRPAPSLRHNLFEDNLAGVFCSGSNPEILVNQFKNNTCGVEIGIEYSSYNSDPTIHDNNFLANGNPVKLYGNAVGPNSLDVDATNNYWNSLNAADIRQMILDKQDAGQFAGITGTVLFTPFRTVPIDSAGIVKNK
jgi:nitrous oxidase accessory protein NosD